MENIIITWYRLQCNNLWDKNKEIKNVLTNDRTGDNQTDYKRASGKGGMKWEEYLEKNEVK